MRKKGHRAYQRTAFAFGLTGKVNLGLLATGFPWRPHRASLCEYFAALFSDKPGL